MKIDNRIEELLPFYALDALTDDERELVENYLAEHPELQDQVKEMGSTVSVLPYSVPPVEPSDRIKNTLTARVAAEKRASSPARSEPAPSNSNWLQNLFGGFRKYSFGAILSLIAVVTIIWLIALNAEISRLKGDVAALKSTVQAQESSLEHLTQSYSQLNAKLPLSTPSTLTTISLSGTAIQPQARGQLIADPNSHSAVLIVNGLAPLQSGRIYQVWLIQGDTPKSASLLTVDAQGQGVVILTAEATIGSFDALGISLEPEGGSPKPTGDIVLLGKVF